MTNFDQCFDWWIKKNERSKPTCSMQANIVTMFIDFYFLAGWCYVSEVEVDSLACVEYMSDAWQIENGNNHKFSTHFISNKMSSKISAEKLKREFIMQFLQRFIVVLQFHTLQLVMCATCALAWHNKLVEWSWNFRISLAGVHSFIHSSIL